MTEIKFDFGIDFNLEAYTFAMLTMASLLRYGKDSDELVKAVARIPGKMKSRESRTSSADFYATHLKTAWRTKAGDLAFDDFNARLSDVALGIDDLSWLIGYVKPGESACEAFLVSCGREASFPKWFTWLLSSCADGKTPAWLWDVVGEAFCETYEEVYNGLAASYMADRIAREALR